MGVRGCVDGRNLIVEWRFADGDDERLAALAAELVQIADSHYLAASYVDKILKGAKPADLPVEQPTRFPLRGNRKTAKSFGMTIPQSIVLRADQIVA